MYKIGDAVRIVHNGTIGAVIGVEPLGSTTKYARYKKNWREERRKFYVKVDM